MKPKRKKPDSRPLPVTPPARYCPKCERQVKLNPPTVHDIYDCTTCEILLFGHETDEFPGQTKGKGSKVMLAIPQGKAQTS